MMHSHTQLNLPFEMCGGMGEGHCLAIRFELFTRLLAAESGLSKEEQRWQMKVVEGHILLIYKQEKLTTGSGGLQAGDFCAVICAFSWIVSGFWNVYTVRAGR